jgi:hypothetical protein
MLVNKILPSLWPLPSVTTRAAWLKYAVGARCNKDAFSSYELVAACIHNVKDKMVAILNYVNLKPCVL